jgi:hypothetical protein
VATSGEENDNAKPFDFMEAVERTVGDIVSIEPSPGGAFAKHVECADMLKNLGGQNDTNDSLTRRLLLLLEGEWLVNQREFTRFRRKLIEIYIQATPRERCCSLLAHNDRRLHVQDGRRQQTVGYS